MDVDEAARLIDSPAPECWPAFAALAWAGDARSLQLLRLQLTSNDWTRRRAAAESLGRHAMGMRATDEIRVSLDDPSPFVVRAALEALAELGDKESHPRVLDLLRDPDAETRRAALRALNSLWEPDVWSRVLATAREDPSADVRKGAGWVLRDHVAANTWEALFDVWSISDLPRERTWAIELAAEFGGASARDRVRPFLSDQNGHVRSAAERVTRDIHER